MMGEILPIIELLVTANLNSKKSRIDFSPPKTLIARHEFITDKSIAKTIAACSRD